MKQILKYPRTRHLEGSQLGPGDEDLRQIRFREIAGQPLVVEEKLDGANCGVSFDSKGNLRLQSRGHYLSGGPREAQFALFKQWAHQHHRFLWECLADRFVMYGEWLFAKHTIFYDRLPSYFIEFDIFDRMEETFLDSIRRQELLKPLVAKIKLVSAPVLQTKAFRQLHELTNLMGPSEFISDQVKSVFGRSAVEQGQAGDQPFRETDLSGLMEGLYIKVEKDGIVQQRLKFVRVDFKACVDQSEGHWMNRPIIRNGLAIDGASG